MPVGLKAQDGKTYVLVGDHKPLNSELVPYAAKTITMKGKVVSRNGVTLLENAEIVKQSALPCEPLLRRVTPAGVRSRAAQPVAGVRVGPEHAGACGAQPPGATRSPPPGVALRRLGVAGVPLR